jgi:hypothetical protein
MKWNARAAILLLLVSSSAMGGVVRAPECVYGLRLLSAGSVSEDNSEPNEAEEPLPKKVHALRIKLQDQWKEVSDRLRASKARSPFHGADLDPNEIGKVHLKLESTFPPYRVVYQALASHRPLQEKEYLELGGAVSRATAQVLETQLKLTAADLPTDSSIAHFAAYESLRVLSSILPQVAFEAPKRASQKQAKPPRKAPKSMPAGKPKITWRKNPPDKYRPNNKELSSSSGGSKTVQAWTDVGPKTPYLVEGYLDSFNPDEGYSLPELRPQVSKPGRAVGKFVMTLEEPDSVVISYPVGFQPIVGNYEGFSVREDAPDQFRIEAHRAGEWEVPLFSLAESPKRFLSATHLDAYKRPSGIALDKWPEDTQALILQLKKGGKSDKEIVRTVRDFIHSKDYFSLSDSVSDEKLAKYRERYLELRQTMPEPLAMAHTGAFNCDGAAFQMALQIRDHFGIPARVAHGPTLGGKRRVGGAVQHLMFAEDPRHAWVEVWFEGEGWVTYDPTPPHSVGGNQTEKMDYEQADFGNEKKAPPPPKPVPGEKNPDETKKGEGEESASDKEGTKASADGKKEKKPREKKDEITPVERRSVLHELEKPAAQYGLDQLSRVIEAYYIENILHEGKGYEFLREARGLGDGVSTTVPTPAKAAEESLRAFLRPHHEWSFTENLARIGHALSDDRIEDAYFLAREMGKDLRALGERTPLTAEQEKVQSQLKAFEASLFTHYRREDSADQALVQTLINNVPGNVAKDILLERFGRDARTLGSIASQTMAAAIRSGALKHFSKVAAVRDVVNRWLRPSWDKSHSFYSTFDKARVATEEQVPLITRDLGELHRWIIEVAPGQSFFHKFLRGEQFAIGSTEKEIESVPRLRSYSRKTFVLWDKSGSMKDMIDVQDALLSGVYSKAASETDSLGRPNHSVVSAAFGSNVDENSLKRVSDKRAAREAILALEATPSVASDGTEIEKALLWFLKEIGTAYQLSKGSREAFRLQRANFILFTDGEADVKLENIFAAMEDLPEDLEIGFHFVAIGGKNAELEKLAEDLISFKRGESEGDSKSKDPKKKQKSRNDVSSVFILDRDRISRIQYEAENPIGDEADSFKAKAVPSRNTALDKKLLPSIESVPPFVGFSNSALLQSQFEAVGLGGRAQVEDFNAQSIYEAGRFLISASNLQRTPTELRLRLGKTVMDTYDRFFRHQGGNRDLNRVLELEREKFEALRDWVFKQGKE